MVLQFSCRFREFLKRNDKLSLRHSESGVDQVCAYLREVHTNGVYPPSGFKTASLIERPSERIGASRDLQACLFADAIRR